MTENEARRIAQRFVIERSLDECFVVSVRKKACTEDLTSTTHADEWVVQFQFKNDGTHSAEYCLVIVDDVTGEPRSLESL